MTESSSTKEVGFADLMCLAKAHDVFTSNELDLIVQYGLETEIVPASIRGMDSEIDTSIRNSGVSWIEADNKDTAWVYDRIFEVVKDANYMFWRFKLNAIERLQFTKYDSTKEPQFYTRHVDICKSKIDSQRKLSFTLQLTDGDEYEGGDLLLHDIAGDPIIAKRNRGAITIFPSFAAHEVTPVTKGIRYSLVGWILGPSFQ